MISQTTVVVPSGSIVFQDTACGASADLVKASSCNVYSVRINNQNNNVPSYVKLYNASSVTVGSTDPDSVIEAPPFDIITVYFTNKAFPGVTYPTALSVACLTQPGTLGVVPPTNPVTVEIYYL